MVYALGLGVSIHAPRTGCDERRGRSSAPSTSFNSRTPHGVRLLIEIRSMIISGSFNSRTPHGVRPHYKLGQALRFKFQFTHPARGATWMGGEKKPVNLSFNSRTPHGVRPCLWCVARVVHWFQFTHPARGATLVRKKAPRNVGVSIHAPRTGCDKGNDHTECTPTSFNSRTPHGVRQALRNNYDTIYIVSIHAPRTGCDCRTPRQHKCCLVSIHAPRTGCDNTKSRTR